MILLIMILFLFFLSNLFMMLNLFISKKELLDREKMSSFECGFTPLSSSRLPFSINFFIVGILFLIFDIEVVFLFPFINLFNYLMFYEFMFISIFIMMLLYMGLEFEKSEGTLKWIF